MKKNRIIIGLLYFLVFTVLLSSIGIVRLNHYTTFLIMDNDGYAISKNSITKNLFTSSMSLENEAYEAVAFNTSDIVYKKSSSYYMGEEKTKIEEAYPLFVNGGSTLLNINSSANLIADDFESVPTYSGLYINNGVSFNPDMERAYREEFILLSLENGLYINTMSIDVAGSFFVGKNISANSIIHFMENEIRYYSQTNGEFKPYIIEPLNSASTITINNKTYYYYDFLEKLGLYDKAELLEIEQDAAPEEVAETEIPITEIPAPPTPTPIIVQVNNAGQNTSKDTSIEHQGNEDGQLEEIEVSPTPTVTVTPTATPTVTELPEKENQEDEEEEEEGIAPTPVGQGQEDIKVTPKPPEPAAVAELPELVLPDEVVEQVSEEPVDLPGGNEEEENPGNPNWKKPVAKVGTFSTTVYSILSRGLEIENNEFLYRTGVSFSVYEGTKLVMKKAYGSSADVKIAPLKPDTDYHVVVQMDYLDKYGKKITEDITETNVHTKPLSELVPMKLNWTNGNIFYNKLQLANLSITNAISSSSQYTDKLGNLATINEYIETVQYMGRVEVIITSKTDSEVQYILPVSAKDLAGLKTGVQIVYESNGKILSNTEYDYEFICYDRFGNVLPLEGSIKGNSHTCKQPPKAEIIMVKNEVKNIELKINMKNEDMAEISEESLFFSVFDKNDNPILTTVNLTDKAGNKLAQNENGESHAIPLEGCSVQFLDLLDYEVYKIRVYCDYNINDNRGVYPCATIGEMSFTTMPISSLGYAFFKVEVKSVEDSSAAIAIGMDIARTDSRLVKLISNLDISFVNADGSEATGVDVTYHKSTEEPTQDVPSEAPNNGIISMTPSELELMKTNNGDGSNVTYVFNMDNLKSFTEYKIKIKPKVQMGQVGSEIYREIETYYTPESFHTLKKSPVIDIEAIYASSTFIQLYGVTVKDPDTAVITYPVTVAVYDQSDVQVATFEITSKERVSIIDVPKLKKDKTYTFRFFAKEFNNGYDRTTYRKNYELYYSELFEKKEYLKIATREAITGDISILQLNKNKLIKSVEIPAKKITSYNTRVTLYQNYRFGSNGQTKAKFSLDVDFGQEQWNSLQIGYSYVNRTTNFKFYLDDPDVNKAAVPFATQSVTDLTRGTEYCRWSDVKFFDDNLTLSGVRRIYIVAETADGTGGINCLWGVRFHKTQLSEDSHYYANLSAIVSDQRGELGATPSYLLKIYKDGAWIDTRRQEWIANGDGTYTLRMYQVAPDKTETLVDTKVYSGSERTSDTDFYYEVEKGYHTYRFDLWAVVFDYEISLDQEEFTTEREIIGIKTADELADVRYGLDKKYYVIKDIVFPLNWNNITASQTFNGELDFRGHTLKYNSTANLISTIGYYGKLKNLVFTYVEGWGSDVERKTDRIVTYNYGKISNIMALRNNGNKAQTYKTDSAAICHTNYESGVIENFVVKTIDPFITTTNSAGVCVYNRGIIRNGYIYGAPMQRTSKETLTEDQFTANNNLGGIVAVNRQTGIIENVYSLMDIETREMKSVNDYTFGLVGLNDGTLRNSFYAGDVFYGGEIWQGYGPAYRNRYATSSIKDTYYYSENDYGKTVNKEISKLVLYDDSWYERLFNASNSTVKNQFNMDAVELGFYPQVVWPKFMPEQDYNPLPELTDEDNIKIVDTYITEQGENFATAVITFDNPDKFEIKSIGIQWLNTQILSQEEDGDFYRVTVRLTQAAETKFYSSYDIITFSYMLGFKNIIRTVDYLEDNKPTVAAEFYKPVDTIEKWSAMKDDYSQNYRLYADLSFQFLDPKILVMPANVTLSTSDANFSKDAFSGKLDGNNHKISFADTGTYGYIFGKLKGTIKNLTVENLDATKGNTQFKGFIGRMLEGSVVDNVHILGMDAISYEHCGAIAGDAYSATIMNSSAHDVKIQSSADGNYAQYIGGLVGKHRLSGTTSLYANLTILNCYVDGVDLKVLAAGDCGGVGGLIGFIRASAEIYHVYVVNGKIDTVYKNAGGLIGAIDTYTNSESSFYMLKDYYVDVDITTITKRAGGIVGFSTVTNGELEETGLVLGNTVTSLPSAEDVGRFYGYNKVSSGKIYGYEYSILNGAINNDSTLLTYQKLIDPTIYEKGGILDWDADFVRNQEELAKGILPKLNRIDGTGLLPYQEDYHLENSPIKIKSISSKNYSTGELYTVQIITEHSPEVTITGATFNGLLPADLGDPNAEIKISRTELGTTLEYVLGIEGYYDCYYLTGFNYNLTGDAEGKNQSAYLSVGIVPQYLKIGSVDEWNTLMSKEMFGTKRYNIQITGDLNFNDYHGNAAKDVVVNHIMGNELAAGSWKKVKGINMESTESFIKAAYGNVSYLSFEDITMTKSLAKFPAAINSYGIISAVTGDMHDVSFKEVKLDAYNSAYAGIVPLAYGMNYNISLTGVTVYDTYASTVPAKRAVGGLVGRLSGSGGCYDITATNLIVQGRDYVGGIVGTQEDGRYLWNIKVDNAVVSAANASYNYIGGVVGYADVTSLQNVFGNCSIKNSVVEGSTYVGGLAGLGSLIGDSRLSSLDNDKYLVKAEKVFVVGTGSNTGGVVGQGVANRAQVRNSYIYSIYNIGGVSGNGSSIFSSVTDSTIGSVYDRNVGDTGNTVFRTSVNDRIAYYQGLLAGTSNTQAQKVYTEAIKVLGYLTTTARTTSWSAASFTGNNNTRIGGISGRSITINNCIVANSRIGSFGAVSVGGIVARTEAAAENSGGYKIASSGTQNCEIYGAEDVGGIVGSHFRGYIESCYSNSNVTATTYNAGGIAGKVRATSLYSMSETPYINHVFYTGTVTAPDYVGGIVGKMEQDLYNVNQGWLMAGDVVVKGASGKGNFFLNKQLGDARGITSSLVYENSKITFGTTTSTSVAYYQANPILLLRDEITFVTTAEMKTKSIYVDKLFWSSDAGITSSNYSARYWNYNGLTRGYMPYLTNAPMNNYDMTSSMRILKFQEGYEADPLNEGKAKIDSNGLYVYQYESYNGGIPVPGSGANTVKRSLLKTQSLDIPKAEFYTVDADQLNIEFTEINENASFKVMANGKAVAESIINQRTFTLEYDFKTELEIIINNGLDELSYTVWPEDINRNIMTWNADYYYIATNKVEGSNITLPGQYVNLYAGHALDVYGKVYEVQSGQVLRNINGIGLAKEVIPIHEFTYADYTIETYKNYSIINQTKREKLRLYVKNEELSAISSTLSMVMDSLILDNYNGSKYCSILSTDGMIVDMTDNKLNIPEEFENSDIQYMTNNINSTNHIVLVRYYDGAVAGFNYITGEMLEIDSPRGTTTNLTAEDGFLGRSANTSMTNFATLYMEAIAFETNITDIGWAEVNGANIVNGEAVTSEVGVINEDTSMEVYVEDTFVLDDGTIVGDKALDNTTISAGGTSTSIISQNSRDEIVTNGAVPPDTQVIASDGLTLEALLLQAEDTKLASIRAAIAVVAKYGATKEELEQLETMIDKLSEKGISVQAIEELKSSLEEAIKEAAEKIQDVLQATSEDIISDEGTLEANDTDESNLAGLDNSNNSNNSDKDEKNGKAGSKHSDSGKEKDSSTGLVSTDGKKADEDKVASSILTVQQNSSKDKANYISVYDETTNQYLIYDEKELLSESDTELTSVNDKVKKSGHMIDYKAKYRADIDHNDDENIYGFILLAAAISGIALLLGGLVLKKHKEASE